MAYGEGGAWTEKSGWEWEWGGNSGWAKREDLGVEAWRESWCGNRRAGVWSTGWERRREWEMGKGEQGLGIAVGSEKRRVGKESGITGWEQGVRAWVGTGGQGVGAEGESGR